LDRNAAFKAELNLGSQLHNPVVVKLVSPFVRVTRQHKSNVTRSTSKPNQSIGANCMFENQEQAFGALSADDVVYAGTVDSFEPPAEDEEDIETEEEELAEVEAITVEAEDEDEADDEELDEDELDEDEELEEAAADGEAALEAEEAA